MNSSLKNYLHCFLRRQEGSATIEVLLWIPLLFALLLLTIDVVLICTSQSRALRIVQDANRAYSIGVLASAEATKSFIESRLESINPNATVNTTLTSGIISSTVLMPATDLSSFGVLPNFDSMNVGVSAQQIKEPTS